MGSEGLPKKNFKKFNPDICALQYWDKATASRMYDLGLHCYITVQNCANVISYNHVTGRSKIRNVALII